MNQKLKKKKMMKIKLKIIKLKKTLNLARIMKKKKNLGEKMRFHVKIYVLFIK